MIRKIREMLDLDEHPLDGGDYVGIGCFVVAIIGWLFLILS